MTTPIEDDVVYRPLADGLDWVAARNPQRCLVLGPPLGDSDPVRFLPWEIRTVDAGIARRLVWEGTYAFRDGSVWNVVVARDGLDPRPAITARRRFTSEVALNAIAEVFDERWNGAVPDSGRCSVGVGDVVRPKGQELLGRVERVVGRRDGYEVSVRIEGHLREFGEDALERLEGDPGDPTFWISGAPADAESLAATLTWTKLHYPLTDTIYSFSTSKTVFRAYQFIPVLKLLSASTGRLLIADEVGLGKTIEAGLIWNELEQRAKLDKVLVIAPAALQYKWQIEMQRRFARSLPMLKPADLQQFAERMKAGQDPSITGVVSIQALRVARNTIEMLTEVNPRFDLVIVDEAHALRNQGTVSYLLGQSLSDWTDFLIFLSATPLNLGRDDLFNLINLLDEGQFSDREIFQDQLEPNRALNEVARLLAAPTQREPRTIVQLLDEIPSMQLGAAVANRPDFERLRELLDRTEPLSVEERVSAKRLIAELNTLSSVLTRTRKVDVMGAKAVREARQVDIEWTDLERDFYRAVRRLYSMRAMRSGTPPGFAMQMPLRQAASCIPAMQQLLREQSWFDNNSTSDNIDYSFADIDESTDDSRELIGGGIDLSTLPVQLDVDTKFDGFLATLRELQSKGVRQALVFSYFRRTLSYLRERLETEFRVRVMSGKTTMQDRETIIQEFRNGDFDILLCSEVGSEGLDFEFCNVLVNYDLPWNPMRVEQRIGRLDRFGQLHDKIFIYNMHVPGTIETDIFERLYQRIGLFTESIGDLEPILRDEIAALNRDALDPNLDDAQLARRVDRVAQSIESKRQDINTLSQSEGILSTLDELTIEGITESGPADGRYVGPSEVRRIVTAVIERHGGKLSAADSSGIATLTGTPDLGSDIRFYINASAPGSTYSVPELASLFSRREPIKVTFDADVASRKGVELLSSRHPLVSLAKHILEQDPLSLRRFGAVEIPGISPGRLYLANLDLAHSTGVRPRLELWVTAIDLKTSRRDDSVGTKLLAALSNGSLGDLPHPLPTVERRHLELINELRSARRSETERFRDQDNKALVDARIESRQHSLELKIERVSRTIKELTDSGGNPAIIRMHQGRRDSLRRQQEVATAEIAPKRSLTLSLSPVALAIVGGRRQ